MLMKLWTGDWENQLERMNTSMDDYNGGSTGMGKGRIRKVQPFPSNGFWKNVGCLVNIRLLGYIIYACLLSHLETLY